LINVTLNSHPKRRTQIRAFTDKLLRQTFEHLVNKINMNIIKNPGRTVQETHFILVIKTNQLMLRRKIIAAFIEIRTSLIN
jgi:hypothetical protein